MKTPIIAPPQMQKAKKPKPKSPWDILAMKPQEQAPLSSPGSMSQADPMALQLMHMKQK